MINDEIEIKPFLLELDAQERENFDEARLVLGVKFDLLEATGVLCTLLLEVLNPLLSLSTERSPQVKAMTALLLNTRFQYLCAAINVLKGHYGNSQSFFRKAIEQTLFILRIADSAPAGAIWMSSHEDGTAYRDEFGWRHLKKYNFPWLSAEDLEWHRTLIVKADDCSNKHVHATSMSAIPKLNFNKDNPDEMVMSIGLTDSPEFRLAMQPLAVVELGMTQLGSFLLLSRAFKHVYPDLGTDRLESVYVELYSRLSMHLSEF